MKNRICLLIVFSAVALIALSSVQTFLIKNAYKLEKEAIIRETNDLTSQIRKSPKIDSLSRVWQRSLTFLISDYEKNQLSKSNLRNNIKKKADFINPSYKRFFYQKIREAKLSHEIKFRSNLKSVLITSDDKTDTIYYRSANNPIILFGDNFENSKAFIVNTSIISSRVEVSDSAGNNLNSKNDLKFEVISEDLVFIKNQNSILFERMASLLVISIFIFLFVIMVLFFSIKSLITQKKIAEIKTDFVNNVTHEFKTPLATLGIAVKSLENKAILESPDFLDNTIKIIQRQNIRLQLLVDEVMNNSLSSKNINLHKEEVFDSEYFQQVLEDFELSTNLSKLTIEKKLNSSEVVLSIDKFHFTTAIRNILENALKHGLKPSKITFKTQVIGNSYIVEICNNSDEIDKKKQKKIFDKFYRINSGNLHNVKEMGLGLYYTKQIIEAHKGTISVYNKENKVCFTIRIPVS